MIKRRIASVTLLAAATAWAGPMDPETRIDCQKRIDAVFDRHRSPAGLSRDAVAMDGAARARVDATLVASAALESF